MMKKIAELAAVSAVAFGCGCVVAMTFGRGEVRVVEEKTVSPKTTPKKTRTDSSNSEVESLRARIRELESELAAKGRSEPSNPPEATAAAVPVQGRRGGDWLERMKKENPANYTQMTNRIAQRRIQRRDRTVDRLELLSQVDVSGWSEGARKVHEEYQELLVRSEELMDAVSPANPDSEARAAALAEMGKTFGRLHELGEKERNNLMTYTTKEFGFSNDEARELTESVKAVYDVTSEFNRRGHRDRRQGRQR